ncbi:MAG TPA: DUF1330 domain-containing protein [Acidimicrobiia bacterium]|nr:DUF1330 domain-containing protein [Acidimicrobiia bacterium]
MAITPNEAQFLALAEAPDDQPVVMLNLLKYKARADDGERSGEDAYASYGATAVAMVEERGGKVLWAGRADQILIGDPDEDWDQVVLVQYPSRAAFLDMVSQPDYLKAHEHRESGLERTVLVACTEAMSRLPGRGES